MEQISIITYQGKNIVFLNGQGLLEKDLCIGIEKLTDLAISKKINLFLLDITKTHTTPAIKEVARNCFQRCTEKLGKVYSALVGLSVIQRLIANAIDRNQYYATDLEDAKRWLAKRSTNAN